jgi:hypothetical protein
MSLRLGPQKRTGVGPQKRTGGNGTRGVTREDDSTVDQEQNQWQGVFKFG